MRAGTDAGILEVLAEVSLLLRTSPDFDTLSQVVAESARSALGIAESRVFLVEEHTGSLRPWLSGHGAPGEPYLPPAGGVLEWSLRIEEPMFAATPPSGGPVLEEGLWEKPAGAFFALPLRSGGRLLGLWVATWSSGHPFRPQERLLAHLLADFLSLGLERRRCDGALAERDQRVERLEARAEEGEGLLAQMLSVVAHEMRTPLTCIKAYTETLIDTPEEQWPNRVTFLEIINEECDRLGRLLTNALDYSRLGSGQRSLHLTTLLPQDLLADVVMTLGPEAKRQKVELAFRVPDEFGSVEGDLDLLKQLCINLTGNAIKFSPEGSRIDLEVTGDEERWRIDVFDRGPGIPEDQRERIFERFYRVEQEGRRAVPGTGLGLAIARGISDLHGGSIWAEARPGGGSRFSVALPRAQRAPASVRRVAGPMWSRPDVIRLFTESVQMISEVMEAQIVSAMLVDPERGDLRVAASLGLDEAARKRRVGYRGGVSGKALAQGTPVLVNDIETDPRFRRPSHPQYFTKSLLCVPLIVDGESVGVVNVNNKRSRQPFDENDLALLSTLVERVTAAAQRCLAFPEAADVGETVAGLRTALDRRRGRAECRQAPEELAYALARKLGAAEKDARRLQLLIESTRDGSERGGRAAPGAPDTHSAEMHPGDGSGAIELGGDAAILLGRQEWWDGSGHPRGLVADRIPLGARILAVVDLLHGLLDGNSCRPALAAGDAVAELERRSGCRLDERVVEAAADLLGENGAAASIAAAESSAAGSRAASPASGSSTFVAPTASSVASPPQSGRAAKGVQP